MKIKIDTNSGLNTMEIDLIRSIEKDCDGAMSRNGFTRTETSKEGDRIELNYRQFAVAHVGQAKGVK